MRTWTNLPYTKEFNVAAGNYGADRLPIKTIVIHSIVGSVNSAASRFATPGQFASSNYIIGEDGKLYRVLEEYLVPFTNGNYQSNRESITIEHADYGKPYDPRPEALYKTSAKLVADLCREYKIPCSRSYIKKHREISGSSTECPAGLDVDKIVREAAELLKTPAPGSLTDAQKIAKITELTQGTGMIFKYKIREILQK